MGGTIALVGSGEFTPAMLEVDRALLAGTGREHPRVAIVPTASWPDGPPTFQWWADQGEAHFSALGAVPVPVLIRDRATADDPVSVSEIQRADVVYLSGGKPGHLLEAFRDSAAGAALREAHSRGAVIAGCSAGAMVLGGHQMRFGQGGFAKPAGWQEALGLVPGLVVMPHYDAIPETLVAPLVLAAPTGSTVIGIDENTALVGLDGEWRVHGSGRVTVWRGLRRKRYRAGSVITLGS
jgi:cyanophycinase